MRLKAEVAYDGSGYAGWQKQPERKTIQSEIEQALATITQTKVTIHGSGRTDAGVHGLGQTFHFDTERTLEADAWVKALNALLPKDIRIRTIMPVSETFHARFSACEKTYEYRLNIGSYNLFERNYVYQYNRSLDLKIVQKSMALFEGEHDFTAFNATPVSEIKDQVRIIRAFDLSEHEGLMFFRISANGFLRYMVRRIVGTCVAAGSGKIALTTIEQGLNSHDKGLISHTIGSQGLYLVSVSYNEHDHLSLQ